MIDWYKGTRDLIDCKFSIIIPTWNNIEFLKLCIKSIEKNSGFRHQIIIHVNEGKDGTLEWVREMGFDFTYSSENVGVCWAMNACRSLVKTDYIAFLNDDMYVLPNWDVELWHEVEAIDSKYFFLSSTVIEPRVSPHLGVLAPFDYGDSVETFKESELLRNFMNISGADWSGATWPPNLVHRNIWDMVGGYSVEYFPGLYSDPDFSMKLYEAGVRFFKGVDASRAYHFGSKSTRRVRMNNGSKQFLYKWGITSASFTRVFLKRGQPYMGEILVESDDINYIKAIAKSRLKRFFLAFSSIGKASGPRSVSIN